MGRRLGVVDDERWDAFSRKCELVSRETTRLATARTKGDVDTGRSALEWLRRPGVAYDQVAQSGEFQGAIVSRETLRAEFGRRLADQAIEQIETSTRYAGYVAKQQADVERAAKAASTVIPPEFDPDAVRALSFEVRHVLKSRRPTTIGEAARLPGVTPAAISLLLVHVKKQRRENTASSETVPADA
jgi:tRNA uridine 5-carboxymethylaminomethyl modification enzyme